ncbi:hypothetical protein BT96DRAFT_952217, partial [Gymnopus androsaceus JB14]
YIQLLRRSLYPATLAQGKIKTVATFRYLEQHGLEIMPWRYTGLMHMCLQWRHPKLLKCTKEGDLVVPCLSCPHPGINLPDGWENDVEHHDNYSVKVTEDTNFRLKEQLVSSHSRDPGLVEGLGYFVGRSDYEKYVISRASEADAIAKATTKFSKGLRYTGVGSMLCARSEIFLANRVGNLQEGEHYANMDYVFGSALHHYRGLPLCIVGYDIVCQWFAHIHERSKDLWPNKIKLDNGMDLVPVIGKFHEPAHETNNHEQYSCNLIPRVGCTDFEACKRIWGLHNPLGNSTKTMGPGTRSDSLEAHFGYHNWQKYTNM